ncbi:hypothetical protein KC976_04020 [Candidatus Saccharibacteria bacterium]|nr:hypothetical protein [Candidatus Saccharibacteria bacterium]
MDRGRENVPAIQEETEGLENESKVSSEIEPTKDETPYETVERVLAEIQQADGQDSGEENDQEETNERQTRGRQDNAVRQQAQEIAPPASFNAEEKEAFNKAPKKVKEAFNRLMASRETHFHRVNTDLQRRSAEIASIMETVTPYYNSKPELMEAGYTPARFIGSLVAAHQKLLNPETKIEALLGLAEDVGIEPEDLMAIRDKYQGTGRAPARAAQVPITSAPEFIAIQNELHALRSQISQPAIDEQVRGINDVINARDAQGRYIYPKMHEPGFYENSVKPLAQSLLKAAPTLTAAEAVKRAYQSLEPSAAFNQASHSASVAQQSNTNRQPSAISVRGRTSAPTSLDAGEFPPEALSGSARDTAAWVMKQLRGN